jgi:hypothetical protein
VGRLCITKNINQNYNRIPCFVEMKSKQQIKSMVFYYKMPIAPLTFPKIVSLIHPLLPITFFFWVVPSHIIMFPKTTRIQNSN